MVARIIRKAEGDSTQRKEKEKDTYNYSWRPGKGPYWSLALIDDNLMNSVSTSSSAYAIR